MSNGDPVRAGVVTTSQNATVLVGRPGPFPDETFLRVGEPPSTRGATGRVDGIHAFGTAPFYSLDGGAGIVGFGALPAGTGVVGMGGTISGLGVLGVGGDMHSVPDRG